MSTSSVTACRTFTFTWRRIVAGDALSDQMIRGELVEEKLPNGMTRFASSEFPALPRERTRADRRAGAGQDVIERGIVEERRPVAKPTTDAHWWHRGSLGGGTCCRNLVAG